VAHPNEELLRKGTDALNSGDMQTFLGMHADDVVIHIAGQSQFAGDHAGKDKAFGVLQQQMQMLDGPPQFEMHDVLANDTHGVILGTQHASRGGKQFDDRQVVVLHIEDGKITEVWVSSDDQAAEKEFWS